MTFEHYYRFPPQIVHENAILITVFPYVKYSLRPIETEPADAVEESQKSWFLFYLAEARMLTSWLSLIDGFCALCYIASDGPAVEVDAPLYAKP